MAREGTYPLPGALDGTAQLFSSRRLVTAVPRELDRLYTQMASPSETFIRGPPGDDQALLAWTQLLADGGVPTEGLRFAAWVRMAPSTHTSAHAEFHCAYYSQPCKGWGTTWSTPARWCWLRPWPASGPRAPYYGPRAMPCCGATPWEPRSTTMRDVPRIGGWCGTRMWLCSWRAPRGTWRSYGQGWCGPGWLARARADLMARYLREVAHWVVLPPSPRWSRLMCAGGTGWPVGLSRPLPDAGTLLRYAMGESACAVAGPRPELLGRAVPVAVLDPVERGACPDVVLKVGARLSL